MRPKARILTDQELELMKIVWDLGTATVRQVYETLLESRQVAYTTVLTMMRILEEKGHLSRTREGRADVYQPTRPREQVVRSMVREFVDRVFEGSARHLVLELVKEEEISEKELEEILKA
jgi:predicted transcriptional regulator